MKKAGKFYLLQPRKSNVVIGAIYHRAQTMHFRPLCLNILREHVCACVVLVCVHVLFAPNKPSCRRTLILLTFCARKGMATINHQQPHTNNNNNNSIFRVSTPKVRPRPTPPLSMRTNNTHTQTHKNTS